MRLPVIDPSLWAQASVEPRLEPVSAQKGLLGGATTIERLGQVVDEIADVFAIGKFAGARHGKDVRPPQVLDEFESGIDRITSIGKHHHFSDPRRGLKLPEHLAEQDILMPLHLGSIVAMAMGMRNPSQLATNTTM